MKSVFGGPVRGHVQVELLSAYLDQQATATERAYVDAHLQQCTECRAELDSLRRTVFLLRALPRVAVPRAFTLSEAQVGIRRPATSPGWLGGLVRGLGAVAAIAVIALVAFSVLRPGEAPWNPPQTVALAVPSPAPVAKVIETQPVSAAAPTEAQAQPQAAVAPTAGQPSAETAATVAPEPPQAALMSAPPTGVAAQTAPAPAPTQTLPEPTTTNEAPLLAKAAPATDGPATATASTATANTAAAGAEMGTAATGRGGGGPGSPIGIPPEFLTPEATPPGKPLAEALPSGLRLAYSDLNALWAIDRDGGLRPLVRRSGINTPQLSPDQRWIVYRTYSQQGLQVWAIRWEGGQPKLLLDDSKLPTEGLPAGYIHRAINDTRWGPEGSLLTVTLAVIPDPQNSQQVKTELWQMDVETGAFRRLGELGSAWRPYYSPDGKEYLVLQYGTQENPEGSLTLVDAKNGKSKTVLTFPATGGKNSYDSQVAWTPDGKTGWVAIPTADSGTPPPPNGTKLYRVTANGDVKEVGEIDASEVYWSPAGNAMAYTRWTDETLATKELYLAKPDGTQAQLYASTNQGEFISWSPKGNRFIYQDNFQVFAGSAGQKPVKLANATSMTSARWVSDSQVLASQDTGDGWLLTLRDVNGDAAGLVPLPRESMWDARSN